MSIGIHTSSPKEPIMIASRRTAKSAPRFAIIASDASAKAAVVAVAQNIGPG